MLPLARMSAADDRADVFALADRPGGERAFALRAETIDGSYAISRHILRSTRLKPPICVWQMGTAHRRETRDGATAAKLRLSAFTQLEPQPIHAEDTKPTRRAAMRLSGAGGRTDDELADADDSVRPPAALHQRDCRYRTPAAL